MTCNDCIHADVCYYKSFNDVRVLEKRRNDVEKICKSFIHRDEARPVVRGKWEEYQVPHIMCCSECDWGTEVQSDFKFCPNCGADMRGESDG